jgi:phage recombination protein Bet
MSQEIAVKAQATEQEMEISKEDVKQYIAPNATDTELYFFYNIAKSFGLNPFKKEIHFVKYGDKPGQTIVGYETYIKRAERTGLLDGWSVWIDKDNVGEKAVIEIHRKDRNHPFKWEAYRKEFDKKQSTWNAMPYFMLKKVAISQGFRLAFPEQVGGMPYTPDEINAGVTEALPKEDVVDAEYQNGNSQPAQAAPSNNTTSAPKNGAQKAESGSQNRPTKDQFSKMGVLANELFASKEERLQSLNAWLVNQGYEEVSSASELTKEQAAAFIEELEEMAFIKRQEKQEETNHA